MNLILGIALIGVAALTLILWLMVALWDYGRRGDRSGALSRVGYRLLEENVGRHRRRQWQAVIALLLGLLITALAIALSMWLGGTRWASW